jgi:hypothetical protein
MIGLLGIWAGTIAAGPVNRIRACRGPVVGAREFDNLV